MENTTENKWPSVEQLAKKYGGIEVSRITFPRKKTLQLLIALKNTYGLSISKMMPHYDYVKEDLFLDLDAQN